MPYIGNPIYQSAFVTDQFSGDGTTTAFTMSVAPAGTTNVLVVVSGVVQDPSTYGVVGTTLNFSAAPPSGTGNISCRYLGVPVTGVTTTAYRTVTEFTATASQTTFTPPSYNVGFINVYLNGVLLGSADYTATNGTTVVLATGASAGNILTVESFQISSVANAISNTAGAVTSSNIQTSVALTTPNLGTPSAINLTNATALPYAALPTGSVLQVVQTTSTTAFSTTSASMVATGISASITPRFSTSKILVRMTAQVASSASGAGIAIYRATTSIWSPSTFDGSGYYGIYPAIICLNTLEYLDSPATTSSTTYNLYMASRSGASSTVGTNNAGTVITLMEIAG